MGGPGSGRHREFGTRVNIKPGTYGKKGSTVYVGAGAAQIGLFKKSPISISVQYGKRTLKTKAMHSGTSHYDRVEAPGLTHMSLARSLKRAGYKVRTTQSLLSKPTKQKLRAHLKKGGVREFYGTSLA